MKLFGQILLVCLVFAALEYALALLVVALIIVLIWGLIFETANTVAILLLLLFLRGLEVAPWWTIGASVVLAGIVLVARRDKPAAEGSAKPVELLPPPDENGG